MWTDNYEEFKEDMLEAFQKAKDSLPEDMFEGDEAVLIMGRKKANPVLKQATELIVFCCPIEQMDAVKAMFFDENIVCGFGGLPETSIKELWDKVSITIN